MGFSSTATMTDMSMAPRGIARPSDQQSMKSSQQSINTGLLITSRPSSVAGSMPLEPRPHHATSRASMVMARLTHRVTLVRLPSLPCS